MSVVERIPGSSLACIAVPNTIHGKPTHVLRKVAGGRTLSLGGKKRAALQMAKRMLGLPPTTDRKQAEKATSLQRLAIPSGKARTQGAGGEPRGTMG